MKHVVKELPIIEVMKNGKIKIETNLTPEDWFYIQNGLTHFLQEIIDVELTERGKQSLVYTLQAVEQFYPDEKSLSKLAGLVNPGR